jgi:isopentenyl-diphosphate Delta-isomerase
MEYIVFVDDNGQPTGETGAKLASHTNATKLHLAFSCYIFNENGEVLVTQRADSKKVWPSVWTNSVCGHPGPGESLEKAITRRAAYELGLTVSGIEAKLPRYRYRTPPYNGIIENEFCPVFFAITHAEPNPNPEEVSAYQWLAWDEFVAKAQADTGDVWSWWCKDQLTQLSAIMEAA